MRGAPALLLLLGQLALPLQGALSLSAQGMVERVREIEFIGNRTFTNEALANAIVTRETDCRSILLAPFCWYGAEFARDPYFFNPREFSRDQARLRLFYYQRGYRDATVDTLLQRPGPEELNITFRIQEGDPVRVRDVSVSGIEAVQDSTAAEDLPIQVGAPLSAPVLEASRDTLISRLRNRGYAHADVLLNYSIPRGGHSATVEFDLLPGPQAYLGPISVVGNTTVSETVVRRMLPFREGTLYEDDLLLDGQRNLYNLEIFSRASIVPDTLQMDTIIPLRVEVAEGDAHRVRAGAGFSEAECVSTEIRWASRNFFGGARNLQITGRVSNLLTPFLEQSVCKYAGTGEYGELNWLLSADFTQPWLLSPRNALSASIFGERQSLPDIFIRNALGLNLAVSHTLSPGTPLTFSVRPQLSSLDAAEVFFCSNYLICTPEDVGILQEANWVSPIGIRFSQDRRNQILSPTQGHAVLLDLEYAAEWTGSDFPYVRFLTEGSWYSRATSWLVFASRIRGGWVRSGRFGGLVSGEVSEEVVHPEKRLYAGGSNSVRGFAQNRLGPQVLYLQNVQKLLDGNEDAQGNFCRPQEITDLSCDAGFLPDDAYSTRPTGGTTLLEGNLELRFPVAGPVWEGAAFLDFGQIWEEDLGVDLADLEFTPGMGIRYFSPIGPIRVDLAYRFNAGDRYQVVTSQVRPFDPSVDEESDKLKGPLADLDWVPDDDLALLSPRVLWGDYKAWSLRRFQLHLSIGQAF